MELGLPNLNVGMQGKQCYITFSCVEHRDNAIPKLKLVKVNGTTYLDVKVCHPQCLLCIICM